MATEIEASFVGIEKNDFRRKLRDAGAELVQAEKLMRRIIFDIDHHTFARVRDEGNKITMSYKRVDSLTLTGTDEICLSIDNYEEGVNFLKALGLEPKSEQETLREEWLLKGVEVTIDTWPWIPTYTEIEGPTEEAVREVAEMLGFRMSEAHYGSADQIYKLYYDVTDDDINYCPEIKFTDVPKWLAEKRRK